MPVMSTDERIFRANAGAIWVRIARIIWELVDIDRQHSDDAQNLEYSLQNNWLISVLIDSKKPIVIQTNIKGWH